MLIDAHTHLDHYTDNLPAMVADVERHRIFTISNSTNPESYRRNLEIATGCKWVLPAFGIHPWEAQDFVDKLDEMLPYIERSPLIGEIGLDFHWVKDSAHYPAQRKVFNFFLTQASTQNKVVNLHTKGAEAEILGWLDRYALKQVIVHWYSGSLDIFRVMVQRGFYFTVGVEVEHSAHIQTLVKNLPLSQLLTETDNPGGREWFTGQPGMPHHVIDVIHKVAALKQETPATIQQTVRQNLVQLLKNGSHIPEQYLNLLLTR